MTDKQIPNERRQYEYKSVFTYTDNTTDDNDKIMENLHKQIIFDDVDVKDCIAYAKSQTIYLGSTVYKQMEKVCMVKNQPCEFFDCQFKQMARELKAKEQECEELKRIRDGNFLHALEEQKRADKYFKTLTEIKEIVGIGLVDGLQPEEYSGFLKILQAQILQKISECEVKV